MDADWNETATTPSLHDTLSRVPACHSARAGDQLSLLIIKETRILNVRIMPSHLDSGIFLLISYGYCKSQTFMLIGAVVCCTDLGKSLNILGLRDLICKRRAVDNLKLLLYGIFSTLFYLCLDLEGTGARRWAIETKDANSPEPHPLSRCPGETVIKCSKEDIQGWNRRGGLHDWGMPSARLPAP